MLLFISLFYFLVNVSNFTGCKQNGTKLGDVILPPWAKGDPREFIRVHREVMGVHFALELRFHWVTDHRTKTSYREINEELQRICHCPYIQKCRSLKNAYEYFLHINNPEKYQGYDKDEIQTYNNFHIEPNKYEIGIMTDEILTVILEKQITDMLDLIAYYLGQIEYEQIMWNKPGLFTAACNGMWRRLNPEGKTQLVKIVTDDDKKGRKSNGRH